MGSLKDEYEKFHEKLGALQNTLNSIDLVMVRVLKTLKIDVDQNGNYCTGNHNTTDVVDYVATLNNVKQKVKRNILASDDSEKDQNTKALFMYKLLKSSSLIDNTFDSAIDIATGLFESWSYANELLDVFVEMYNDPTYIKDNHDNLKVLIGNVMNTESLFNDIRFWANSVKLETAVKKMSVGKMVQEPPKEESGNRRKKLKK